MSKQPQDAESTTDDAPVSDVLDASIDYPGIAERSEADRLAGRTLSHADVKRRVAELLGDRRDRRLA